CARHHLEWLSFYYW
nr:immunoglobulin heavy chain junction region [Macaca mulatta]